MRRQTKKEASKTMLRIQRREQLVELAEELGVRPDWHEPDEQEVSALCVGDDFDNAGFWPAGYGFKGPSAKGERTEKHVIIWKGGQAVAAVNLASLLAWASERGYDE
jgi:hypothetical protein